MQSKPVVFFIFYFWSIIELFRLVGFSSYQVCTEQSGCSQERRFWSLCFLEELAPQGPWVMDCSQPSFICQKLRQGWSLKVILPCCFISLVLWISIVKWGLYLWNKVILKGLLGSQAVAFIPVHFTEPELCKLPNNQRPSSSTGEMPWIFSCPFGIVLSTQCIYTRPILVVVFILNCLFPLTL